MGRRLGMMRIFSRRSGLLKTRFVRQYASDVAIEICGIYADYFA